MRIVIALGGNALLRRGEPLTAENQRLNVRVNKSPKFTLIMNWSLHTATARK